MVFVSVRCKCNKSVSYLVLKADEIGFCCVDLPLKKQQNKILSDMHTNLWAINYLISGIVSFQYSLPLSLRGKRPSFHYWCQDIKRAFFLNFQRVGIQLSGVLDNLSSGHITAFRIPELRYHAYRNPPLTLDTSVRQITSTH